MSRPLNRVTAGLGDPAPVRIVHLGLGAFHRAHQAWYTHNASNSTEWGIASFTGRKPDAALALSAQEGVYTLVSREGAGDQFERLGSIVEAHDGGNQAKLSELVAAEQTAIITMTITEPAYFIGADGALDLQREEVAADLAQLKRHLGAGESAMHEPASYITAAGRLVAAFAQRKEAGRGPLAVVSCDNLANNAGAARASILGLARASDSELAGWIESKVSFVGTSVDRITPRTTPDDLALVLAETGFDDSCAVVTEPFSNWILSGEFPAGRPDWESAGALFVDDIEGFENRKLWLLNGAHSLLAYAGSLRGHQTVAQALADPVCAEWVEEFWDEAQVHLPAEGLEIPAYRRSLIARFSNARIAHHLAQIAMEGSSKIPMRAVPVLEAELAAGRSGAGSARMVAAWILFLGEANSAGVSIGDAHVEQLSQALALTAGQDAKALISLIHPHASESFIRAVEQQLEVVANALPLPDHS